MPQRPDWAKRDLWRNRLEEFGRGDERIVDFCRRLRVPVWSFYYWQQRLRIPAVAKRQRRVSASWVRPAAQGRRKLNGSGGCSPLHFVPVQVTGVPSHLTGVCTVEVHLVNGVRLTVPCQDREAIDAVIAALLRDRQERRAC